MKKITINSETRQLSQASTTVGYLQENKVEKLEFEIPEEYKTYGRKACFKAQDKTFAKIFDDITGNTLTLTRDMTQYDELEMSIAFFKTENEDEIVARTSILKIYIENAIICDNDIQPDDPKVIILDELIQKVTKLNDQVTKDEEIRQNQEATRQQNEATREENEQGRVFDELGRKKAEEERKTNELERITNENERKTNEEQRIASENNRVSNETTREEYINNLKTRVDNGDFDGADFNYKWDGTKLGVKNSKETTYQFVELKGQKGDKGDKGEKGDTGNGIQNIEKVSTVENVDTYAINYTDGTQTTFDVTNGEVTKEQLDEVDNKAKKTRNELERVKNDILETGTASDSFINVQDSAWAELQELSVDGVLKQNTTSGKQLFNIKNITQERYIDESGNILNNPKWNISLENIGVSANEEYTFSRNNLEINESQFLICEYKSNGDFIKQNKLWQKGTYKYTITTTSETKFVHLGYRNDFAHSDLMFQKGTDRTQFEPYTGGQPSPSPDYPQEIKTITNSLKVTSCDNGLFDGEFRQGSWNSINNSIRCFSKNNIYVEPGNYLLITDLDINNYRYGILVSNDNYPSQVENFSYDSGWKQANKFEFNLTEAGNLGINVSSINNANINPSIFANVKWLLIKLDLVSIIDANLPENEFIGKINDTYKDELVAVYNQEEGQYHLMLNKNIIKIVMDGKTNKFVSKHQTIYTDTTGFYKFILTNKILGNNGNNELGKSNYLIYQEGTAQDVGRKKIGLWWEASDFNYASIPFTTLEDANNWLKQLNSIGKPLEIYYVTGNPYQIDLGPIDIPLSYNEVTNIFTDSDLLPIINAKYYRNFTKTVQNLQVNEKALKQELIDINNRLTALETAKASESEVNNDIPVE